MLLTKREVAGILQISVPQLNAYLRDGCGGKVGSGPATKYDLKEVIEFHVARTVAQALKGARSEAPSLEGIPDKETSEAILMHWKAERERLRTLTESDELVTVAESTKDIEFRLGQVRQALDSIPATWAPFLVGLSTLEMTQQRLNDQLQLLYGVLSSLPDEDDEANDDGMNEDPVSIDNDSEDIP